MLVYQKVIEGPHPVVIIHEEMSDFPWNQLLGGSERFLVWHRSRICLLLPSGKHTNNYGTSSFLVGKSKISMAMFNSCVSLPKNKWMKLNIRISLRLANGHVPSWTIWWFNIAMENPNHKWVFLAWEIIYKWAIYTIWVNYNISPTWIKAIWGWFPLFTIISRVRSQWGRYNLPRYHGKLLVITRGFRAFQSLQIRGKRPSESAIRLYESNLC